MAKLPTEQTVNAVITLVILVANGVKSVIKIFKKKPKKQTNKDLQNI